MGVGRISYFTVDSIDPDALAPFWAAVLGVQIEERIEDGEYVLLGSTGEGIPPLAFQRVPEAKAGKTRAHLDIGVEDLDAATGAIEALGGTWLEPGLTRRVGNYVWRCMADPEGNEFDIASNVAP